MTAHTSYQQIRIVSGCRYHGQNFACVRFYCHDTPTLILHELLAIGLQVGVHCTNEVGAGRSGHVFLIAGMFANVSYVVTKRVVDSLHSAQLLLIGLFYTTLSEVFLLGIVGVFLVFLRRYLTNVAEEKRTHTLRIYPQCSRFGEEAFVLVELLRHGRIIARSNLLDQ